MGFAGLAASGLPPLPAQNVADVLTADSELFTDRLVGHRASEVPDLDDLSLGQASVVMTLPRPRVSPLALLPIPGVGLSRPEIQVTGPDAQGRIAVVADEAGGFLAVLQPPGETMGEPRAAVVVEPPVQLATLLGIGTTRPQPAPIGLVDLTPEVIDSGSTPGDKRSLSPDGGLR